MSYSHVTDACILKEVCQHFLNRIPSPKEYDISSWKPEPGLFLYAASKMGFSPEHCVVIEDSDVGIQAARLAGIYALKYSHQEEGKEKSNVFSNMELLSKQLDKIYAMKCDRSAYDL
ncbi:MAG: HAD-IA family hydrolase [Nostocaceae cyanobacterium CSU_2_110]|nr:HAD-IA family hydrolase [Richelia sp. SM1_7_0]NJS15980.1 HAD-IA family hydrolase [Nostocaceae cyanobacterium CSU_2_110]